jgi:hypothetical protein
VRINRYSSKTRKRSTAAVDDHSEEQEQFVIRRVEAKLLRPTYYLDIQV